MPIKFFHFFVLLVLLPCAAHSQNQLTLICKLDTFASNRCPPLVPNTTDVCQKTLILDTKKQTVNGQKANRWDEVSIEIHEQAQIFKDDLGTSAIRSTQLNRHTGAIQVSLWFTDKDGNPLNQQELERREKYRYDKGLGYFSLLTSTTDKGNCELLSKKF